MALRADDIDLARDRALVEAWQAGDTSAFDDLYTRYFDRLRSFCERRVGDRVDAEEIAQEAFTKAYQALPRFSGDRRFYPWMTVIASRLCVDHHRRRARVEPTDVVDAGAVDDGHDERLGLQVDLANLDRALSRLGPRHSEVLDLRERRGLTYQEIAGELGVPHSTVETLLFRARRALRREFAAVSADRLAGIPVLGWLVLRASRLRHRMATSGIDFAAIGAPLAAGAVTALFAFPGAAAPLTSVTMSAPVRAASSTPAVVAPDAPPAAVDPAPTRWRTRDASAPAAPLAPMTDAQAQQHASTMPLQLDLGQLGAGLDPTPIVDQLTIATNGRHLP